MIRHTDLTQPGQYGDLVGSLKNNDSLILSY
jgi:hypothetical protein